MVEPTVVLHISPSIECMPVSPVPSYCSESESSQAWRAVGLQTTTSRGSPPYATHVSEAISLADSTYFDYDWTFASNEQNTALWRCPFERITGTRPGLQTFCLMDHDTKIFPNTLSNLTHITLHRLQCPLPRNGVSKPQLQTEQVRGDVQLPELSRAFHQRVYRRCAGGVDCRIITAISRHQELVARAPDLDVDVGFPANGNGYISNSLRPGQALRAVPMEVRSDVASALGVQWPRVLE